MAKKTVLGVQISNRVTSVPAVQKVLTKYGCNIKTRLGLHEVDQDSCSTAGLLILETFGQQKQIKEFEEALKAVKGVVVKKMVFN